MFEKSIYADAVQTLRHLGSAVIIVAALLTILPRIFQSYANMGAAMIWGLLMFYAFQYVLFGRGFDHLKGMSKVERKARAVKMNKGLGGFLAIVCLLAMISVVLVFIGIFSFDLERFRNSEGSLFFIVLLFALGCSLIVHLLLGTWLPAKVAAQRSGFGFALARAPSQGWYIASRLVVCLLPVFLLSGVVLFGVSLLAALFITATSPWQGEAVLALTEFLCFALVGFAFIIITVILSRAYMRADYSCDAGETLAIPYIAAEE
ncbi:hypothetical protein [uncultured Cohaesibacter sp.]|uniref:hypothetical protein n=1 Tax=uncultured Cohaesibacter sp. TaxID=1002546 RepID=UPI0029C6D748|nr:hypothetical protein [uncultured Cohaesibacter sp.]